MDRGWGLGQAGHGKNAGTQVLLHYRACTYLLRAARVDNLSVVLRLLAILPSEVHNELARVLVMTSIDGFHMVFP